MPTYSTEGRAELHVHATTEPDGPPTRVLVTAEHVDNTLLVAAWPADSTLGFDDDEPLWRLELNVLTGSPY